MPPRKRTPKKYPADELKTISSMGTRLDDLQARSRKDMNDLNKKIGGTANRLKFDTTRNAIEIRRTGEADQVKEVTKSVTKILDKLGLTIAALSRGIVTMTAATAMATKEAIQDYGRAISEDIRINKQNFVAMSLSQASPIFGYFVGKLFETQMFRSALEKVKGKASDLFSGLAAKFKKSKAQYEEEAFFEEGEPVIAGGAARRARSGARKARGARAGAGRAGGLAGGASISALREVTITSSENIKEAIKESSKIEVAESRKHFNYFVKMFSGKSNLNQEGWMYKVYNELYMLRSALVEYEEKQGSMFSNILEKHPTLARTWKFLQTLHKSIMAPIKWLFSVRGGYKSDLPRSGNVFKNIFDVLSLIYTKGMLKLDTMISYLGQIGKGILRRELETPKEEGIYTYFGKIKEWIEERKKPSAERKKATFSDYLERFADYYDLDKKAMEEAIGMIPARYKEIGSKAFKRAEEYKDRTEEYLSGIFYIAKKEEKEAPEKEKKTLKGKLIDKLEAAKEKALDAAKRGKQLWGIITTVGMFLFTQLKALFSPIFGLLGRVPGLAWGAAKGLGRAGLGIAGGVYGGYEMLKGGMEGVGKAGEWHGKKPGEKVSTSEKITAGIGGALGGTGGGVSGALAGAAKGAGIGMMVGSIFPGVGTAIGGAVGAIAGGIMGAIGGENIAKGLQYVWDGVKKIVSGVYDVIMFPFKLLKKVGEKVYDTLKGWFSSLEKVVDNIGDWLVEKAGSIPIIGPILVKAMKAAGTVVKYATPAGLAYTAAKGIFRAGEKAPEGVAPVAGAGGKVYAPGIRVRPGVDMSGLNPTLEDKFSSMAQEGKQKGIGDVIVNSAYRDAAKQAELYRKDPSTAAPPGKSMHGKGLAIDINSREANELRDSGLMEKYGLYQPIAREPWHLQMASSAIGDPTGKSAINRRDVITMQVDKETGLVRAFLDSNANLQNTVGDGLEGVSKGLTSNASTISNVIISNSQNSGGGGGPRGGETDLDLTAVMSGNLT